MPKDNLMGGMVKGKSDPYVVINIGGETFRSQVIKGNLNPTWNEMYEVWQGTGTGLEKTSVVCFIDNIKDVIAQLIGWI